MRLAAFALALFISVSHAALAEPTPAVDQPKLEIVAELDQRPGNIAIGLNGRIYVTMHPFDNPKCKVMEIRTDGQAVSYPNEEMSCRAPDKDGIGMNNAIGIRSTMRYVTVTLDMGTKDAPPRVVAFRLSDNQVTDKSPLPKNVLTDQSFLQDFAYDWITNIIYIADMGQADLLKPAKPAIIIYYPNPLMEPRRVLEGHPSLQVPATAMKAEGKDVQVLKDGKPEPVYAALNPITIDPQRGWLYYGPMGAGKIYRVPLDKMKDINLPPEELAASVEFVADKPESDGMTIDAAGNIYLTSVNNNEIGVIPAGGTYRPYIKDERIVWPDGFAFGPDGMLYVTINQLNRAPQLNGGKEEGKKPYLIAKFKPLAPGVIGR